MTKLSFCKMLEEKQQRLQLAKVVDGEAVQIDVEQFNQSSREIIGHLNPIRVNWIEVLSDTELDYLQHLSDRQCADVFQNLKQKQTACLIIAGSDHAPTDVIKLAAEFKITLYFSQKSSVMLLWMIRHYLFRQLIPSTTRHGVFLDVMGTGVLITGESGIGKSELGMELVARGNGLVSDDIVDLQRIAPDTIDGTCPERLRDVIEVRGLGILNIRTMFGETAVRRKKSLKLIVHLVRPPGGDMSLVDRLPLNEKYQEILGVNIRMVELPVAAGRNLAVLVEAAVRNFVMQQRGVNTLEHFIQQHDLTLTGEH